MTPKKVAILTQPLGHNYGGLLQAYALQRYLVSLGCEVETLDRRAKESKLRSLKTLFKNFIKLLRRRIKTIPTQSRQAKVLENLVEFRNRNITLSETIYEDHEIKRLSETKNFDAFIVGSDQVWRPCYSPKILNFYLDFIDKNKTTVRRIAYAASFGVDEWEYSEALTEECKFLVQRFDSVSVREHSAVAICEERFEITPQWTVDPALLLEKDDYLPFVNASNESGYQGKVLAYVLDPAQEKRSISDVVASILDTDTFSIKPEKAIVHVSARNLELCAYPSVELWLKAFHDARFVVTDSFHGVVFSIIFNKPFIAIGNSSRGLARFESLLTRLGLMDRLVSSLEQVSRDLIESEMDWSAVDAKRIAFAEESRKFLRGSLGI
jgi:polysaccharide pyruvyl transferase WcaK-like protein